MSDPFQIASMSRVVDGPDRRRVAVADLLQRSFVRVAIILVRFGLANNIVQVLGRLFQLLCFFTGGPRQ